MAPPSMNCVCPDLVLDMGGTSREYSPCGPFHGAPMEVREVFCMSGMQEGTGNLLCGDGICIADWRGEFCPKCRISSFRAKLFLFYTSAENYHLSNRELRSLKVKNKKKSVTALSFCKVIKKYFSLSYFLKYFCPQTWF